jgi:very-short-patch-repair endonuclease
VIEPALEAIAKRQEGALCRDQVLAAGATDKVIHGRLRSGRWLRTGNRGVYLLTGVPTTHRQRLWIAHLAAGTHSVVSHESAAAILRLTGFRTGPVVLTVPHPEHPRVPGAFVHQISDLQRRHIWDLDGLPVTTTPRTIVDLVVLCGRSQLEIVLDDALAARRVTEAAVARCAFDLYRPGKRGLDKLLLILDARGKGYLPPMSELERRLFESLEAAGLPEPLRQYPLPGRGAITGIVDAAYINEKLILEADGRSWHDRQRAFRKDRLRDNEAARVGWQTLRFPWEEVVGDPEEVAATVADVLSQRGRGMGIPIRDASPST